MSCNGLVKVGNHHLRRNDESKIALVIIIALPLVVVLTKVIAAPPFIMEMIYAMLKTTKWNVTGMEEIVYLC